MCVHFQSHHVVLQKVTKRTCHHLDVRRRGQSGTLPGRSASAVHLNLKKKPNVSSYLKAVACLHCLQAAAGGGVGGGTSQCCRQLERVTSPQGPRPAGSSPKVEGKVPNVSIGNDRPEARAALLSRTIEEEAELNPDLIY